MAFRKGKYQYFNLDIKIVLIKEDLESGLLPSRGKEYSTASWYVENCKANSL